MAVDRVHRHLAGGTTVLHMFTNRQRRATDALEVARPMRAG
jgi:hypothetical protein